jgi:hypothetical protein
MEDKACKLSDSSLAKKIKFHIYKAKKRFVKNSNVLVLVLNLLISEEAKTPVYNQTEMLEGSGGDNISLPIRVLLNFSPPSGR